MVKYFIQQGRTDGSNAIKVISKLTVITLGKENLNIAQSRLTFA